MSARDRGVSTETPSAFDAEGPLRRWARRKREAAREKEAADEAPGRGASGALSDAVQDAREPAGDAPAPVPVEEKDLTDEDMPPIDTLDENSDYRGFLSPGVSEGLRRRALRKLFMSAVFNVRDGLDDYDEDFTNFEALGDIVTSDMRHQAEAESRRARQAQADSGPEDPPEEDSGRTEAGPTADATGDDADAARAGSAGLPATADQPATEELGVPDSASGEEAAGTWTGEVAGPPALPGGGVRDSGPGGHAPTGTAAASEGDVSAGSEDEDAMGHGESVSSPASPEPGDPASDGTDPAAGAPGRRRA